MHVCVYMWVHASVQARVCVCVQACYHSHVEVRAHSWLPVPVLQRFLSQSLLLIAIQPRLAGPQEQDSLVSVSHLTVGVPAADPGYCTGFYMGSGDPDLCPYIYPLSRFPSSMNHIKKQTNEKNPQLIELVLTELTIFQLMDPVCVRSPIIFFSDFNSS